MPAGFYSAGRPAFKPPVPAANFSSKTVIATGANVGLGKEAVKHFACLRAAKVIAMARAAALAKIEAETKRTGVVEFWDLDYSAYASAKAFCARAAKLERLNPAVLNGVGTFKFEIIEQDKRLCRSM